MSENSRVLSLLLGLPWAFSMNPDFQICFDGCNSRIWLWSYSEIILVSAPTLMTL